MAEQKKTKRRDDDPVRVTAGNRVSWWTGGIPGLGKRLQTTCATPALAEEFAVQTRIDLAEERDLFGTFGRLIDDFLDAIEGSAPTNTSRKYESTAENWVRPAVGDLKCSKVDIAALTKCFEEANRAGCGPSVIKSIDTVVGAVIAYGADRGDFGGREPLPPSRRRKVKQRYVALAEGRSTRPKSSRRGKAMRLRDARTPDHVDALAHQLRDAFGGRGADVVRVMAGSGARWCEFLGIEADKVDLEDYIIPFEFQAARHAPWRTLVPLKDHEAREVPVWPSAEESLARLVEHSEDNCLLPRPDGYGYDWIAKAERTFADAMVALGWPARTRKHALRHHFACYSLAPPPTGHGIDLGKVSELLGHATPEYTARIYIHSLSPQVNWQR